MKKKTFICLNDTQVFILVVEWYTSWLNFRD